MWSKAPTMLRKFARPCRWTLNLVAFLPVPTTISAPRQDPWKAAVRVATTTTTRLASALPKAKFHATMDWIIHVLAWPATRAGFPIWTIAKDGTTAMELPLTAMVPVQLARFSLALKAHVSMVIQNLAALPAVAPVPHWTACAKWCHQAYSLDLWPIARHGTNANLVHPHRARAIAQQV